MIVVSDKGGVYTLQAISYCCACGPTAHDIGPEGSLTCAHCKERPTLLRSERGEHSD